jgi:hypothetical protein
MTREDMVYVVVPGAILTVSIAILVVDLMLLIGG